jgi:D-aminopeptidase
MSITILNPDQTAISIIACCYIGPMRVALICSLCAMAGLAPGQTRPRARDLGIVTGTLPTGPLNAITDVAGVLVGRTTVIRGDTIRTGVTAVLPHAGNLYREKVTGAVFVGNGFEKLAGSTQVDELGEIETPIL